MKKDKKLFSKYFNFKKKKNFFENLKLILNLLDDKLLLYKKIHF